MTDEVVIPAAADKVVPAANDAIDSLIPPDDKSTEPVAKKDDALIPTAEELAAADKVKTDKAAADALAAAAKPTWFYADGTPGVGEVPAWFKADKYVTVTEQAKAYGELEKRFGSFVGAPKDGKYELKLPEGITGEFEPGHPLLDRFQKFAATAQMNQEGFDQVLGMLVEYEAMQAPNIGEIKKQIGDNADARIGAVAAYAKANLDANQYNDFRAILGTKEAATTFKLFEVLANKARQPNLPKPGQDVPAGQPVGLEAIKALHNKKGADGKRLYETDEAHRNKVEKMYAEHFGTAS